MEFFKPYLSDFIIYAGGASAIVIAFFKFFGEKWLGFVSTSKLEKFKTELTKDLEKHKNELSYNQNRRLKFSDKEYEVFPEIWSKLCDAQMAMEAAISIIKISPDFTSLTNEKITLLLKENNKFSDFDISEIINSTNKNQKYSEISNKLLIYNAINSLKAAIIFIEKNKIFLNDNLKLPIKDIIDKIFEAIKAYDEGINDRASRSKVIVADNLRKDIKIHMDNIEAIIQTKIQSQQ